MPAGTMVLLKKNGKILSRKRIFSWRFDDGFITNARDEHFPKPKGGWKTLPDMIEAVRPDNVVIGRAGINIPSGAGSKDRDVSIDAGGFVIELTGYTD